MKEGAVVLVIDDEIQIRRFLRMNLDVYGYKVCEAKTGEEALALLKGVRPDLIILDLGLPDMDGLEFLQKLREWSHIPVIVLSVRDSEQEKITLLDAGADDYLTKPFSVGELQARIRNALRHNQISSKETVFTSGDLKIDFDKRIVAVGDEKVKLTPTEYSFLSLLAKHAGKVITHNQIMRELWGPNLEEETQYLRIYVLQLRRKIEKDPSNPKRLITEPGVGYRLVIEE